jgi:hypothetical protein
MAGRQRTTFQKRQKEAKRREKQKMKAEKRSARRQEKAQSKLASTFVIEEHGTDLDVPDEGPVPEN